MDRIRSIGVSGTARSRYYWLPSVQGRHVQSRDIASPLVAFQIRILFGYDFMDLRCDSIVRQSLEKKKIELHGLPPNRN